MKELQRLEAEIEAVYNIYVVEPRPPYTLAFARAFTVYYPALERACNAYLQFREDVRVAKEVNKNAELLESARIRYEHAEAVENRAYMHKELNRMAYDPPRSTLPLGGVGYQEALEDWRNN